MSEVLAHVPGPTNDTLRELAAIHRSDLSLVCSPRELELLESIYGISPAKLQLAPLFIRAGYNSGGFGARRHYVTIGNFRHPPNMDSVQWLADSLWEEIRGVSPPGTELHVYGAYGDAAAVKALHRPERGLHLKGHAPSLDVLGAYRVCLAPLRFGAGLKGKVADSWSRGLPVATTPIGAEGMGEQGNSSWGGVWKAESEQDFAAAAAELYSNEALWTECSEQGRKLIRSEYDSTACLSAVLDAIEDRLMRLESLRARDFTGRVLWMQQCRATEYFSRWIELKERSSTPQ